MKLSNPLKNIFAKKGAGTRESFNPHRHWIVLLATFFVVVVCLILFSLYILYQIKNDQIFQAPPAPEKTGGMLNQPLLDKINAGFDKKAEKEAKLKASPTTYSDPSV